MSPDAEVRQAQVSMPTVIAIAIVAHVLAQMLHEGAGHGGFCLLVGGKPVALNSAFFDHDETAISWSQRRWIAAGGSLVNVATGALAWLALRARRWSPSGHFFLWLFFTFSIIVAFGYLLFSGVLGLGDWEVVTRGWGPAWATRLAMVALGAALYFGVAPRWSFPCLEPFLGADEATRRKRLVKLTLVPYAVAVVTALAAGVLNPYGFQIVLISSAAASMGGYSLLAWYPIRRLAKPGPASGVPLAIPLSPAWIAVAAVVLVIFVAVLGPGIPLGHAH